MILFSFSFTYIVWFLCCDITSNMQNTINYYVCIYRTFWINLKNPIQCLILPLIRHQRLSPQTYNTEVAPWCNFIYHFDAILWGKNRKILLKRTCSHQLPTFVRPAFQNVLLTFMIIPFLLRQRPLDKQEHWPLLGNSVQVHIMIFDWIYFKCISINC